MHQYLTVRGLPLSWKCSQTHAQVRARRYFKPVRLPDSSATSGDSATGLGQVVIADHVQVVGLLNPHDAVNDEFGSQVCAWCQSLHPPRVKCRLVG